MPASRPTHISLAVAALFSAGAQAQTPMSAPVAPPAKTEVPIQKVEITGSQDKYDARKDDTATRIVVSQEEIQKYGDTTIADILKRQPGVTVGGGRGGTEIRMRGLGSGYTQVLLNGEAAPPGFSLDSLSPDVIERIEIVRAATAEFSTQAIAGTINIVLKKAVKVAQREFKLNFAGANVFKSTGASLQISDKLGNFSYSLSGNLNGGNFNRENWLLEDGIDNNGVEVLKRRNDTHQEGHFYNLQLSPRLNWILANGDTVTSQTFLNMNRFDNDQTNAWSTTKGPLPTYAADNVQTKGDTNLFRNDLNWVHKMTGGAKLDTKIGINLAARINDFRQQGYNAARLLTLDSITLSDARERGLTLTGKYTAPFAEDHTLAIGWDGGSSRRTESRLQENRPIPGYLLANTDERYLAHVNRLALFAQDEWNVTPRWSVYFGLRWEVLDTTSEGNDYAEIHNRSSVISPLFQTLWKLPDSKNDQIRFALTRTYKAPATDRLIPRRFTAINNSQVTPDTQGNPNLRPELAWGIDTAYEHFFGGGAMMSVSAYLRRISDFTRRGLMFNGSRWIAMPVNDGEANTRGLELEAKFPLQLFWKAGPAVDVRANISRNWSSVESVPGPDNRLADQTPLSANLGLDYRLNAKFNMGGTYIYKSGGPIRTSETQSTYASIKRELDVYALWKFDPKTQLRISLANVLAQEYVFVERYTDATGSLRNTGVFPVSALLRASLEMKF